jgi:hypothetical protein
MVGVADSSVLPKIVVTADKSKKALAAALSSLALFSLGFERANFSA